MKYLNISKVTLCTLFVFTLLSCASVPKLNSQKTSKSELEERTRLLKTTPAPLSTKLAKQKLRAFKKSLKKTKLSRSDWRLHDQLLEYYAYLKNKSDSTKLTIPANSRIKIKLESYCLNDSKGVPNKKEIYHWQKSDPNIPYYKELLELRRKGKIARKTIQSLLWNLQNKAKWESYPNKQKAILQNIDPNVAYKLPSEFRDKTVGLVKDSILDIPEISPVRKALRLVKGEYYSYKKFKESVESIISKYELSDYNELTQISETALYSQSISNGYTSQEVTVYNPTDTSEQIDLTDYYLAPEREDIQRIGVNPNSKAENNELLLELEEVLYGEMARLGVGFTPIVNDIADVYELFSGDDFINGERLSNLDRLLSVVGVIAGSGANYRYSLRAINSPNKYIGKFSEGLAKVSKKSYELTKQALDIVRSQLSKGKDFIKGKSNLKKYNPVNPGPLHKKLKYGERISDTFRSSTYLEYKTKKPLEMYKVQTKKYSKDQMLTPYWTREKPEGPVQSIIDSALDPEWSNNGSNWIKVEVPKGTIINEGRAASQKGLVGGGNQIFLENVKHEWVKDFGEF